MADLLGELTGTIKKAIDVVDERQQALVEEIKKDGTMIVDKTAETTETVLENIDKHIGTISDSEKTGDSIEHLEMFLDSLKEDIKNLSTIVDQRAKEIQLAVKKNTEMVLEEVEEDLRKTQEFMVEQVGRIQSEDDPEQKGKLLHELNERLTSIGVDINARIDELGESGAETSRAALEEAQKQVNVLSKTVSEMMKEFPVKMKVTPAEGEKAKPAPKAKPKPAKKSAKK